jgi:pimeloyl-ACP methyl ester carboxylesterase
MEPGQSKHIESEDGKPLVFFHAFPLTANQWLKQHAFFAINYRCIAIDFTTLLAEIPDPEPSIQQISAACREVLNSLHIGEYVLIGCSLGGYLAMAMLRQFPDDILGLVLSNTRAVADTPEARLNRQRQISLIKNQGKAPVLAELLPKLLAASTKERDHTLESQVAGMAEQVSGKAMMQLLHVMAHRPDSTELLAEKHVPTCVIAGELDTLMPAAELANMAQNIPGAEYHSVEGSGHLPNLEIPEEFNRILQRFLTKICY